MISLDQVVLLQKKVEAAVAKITALNGEIAQLYSENDALRRKCAELTNALADKSGLVSSLRTEQNQIEQSILKALEQLDTVEDGSDSPDDGDVAVGKEELSVAVENGQGSFASRTEPENAVQGSAQAEKEPEENAGQVSGQTRILDPLALSFERRDDGSSNQENAYRNEENQDESTQSPEKGLADGGDQFDIF